MSHRQHGELARQASGAAVQPILMRWGSSTSCGLNSSHQRPFHMQRAAAPLLPPCQPLTRLSGLQRVLVWARAHPVSRSALIGSVTAVLMVSTFSSRAAEPAAVVQAPIAPPPAPTAWYGARASGSWLQQHPKTSAALVGLALGPAVVVAVPWALGFGAGGIAAGSTAAGMMSSAAAAGGGGVAAGSTVAVLQSVGAAGAAATTYAGAAATVSAATAGTAKAAEEARKQAPDGERAWRRWIRGRL